MLTATDRHNPLSNLICITNIFNITFRPRISIYDLFLYGPELKIVLASLTDYFKKITIYGPQNLKKFLGPEPL